MRMLKILQVKGLEHLISVEWREGEEQEENLHIFFSLYKLGTMRDLVSSVILHTCEVLNLPVRSLLFVKFQPKVKVLLKEMHQKL